jgi:hypothetical protein
MSRVDHKPATYDRHAKLAFFWALLGGVATLAVVPYVLALLPGARERIAAARVPAPVLFGAQFAQSVLMLFVLSWVGLRLGRDVNLDSPLARAWVYRLPVGEWHAGGILLAALSGVAAGLGILAADKWIFMPVMPRASHATVAGIARWKCVLASFYGGIVEELLCRLFLLTLIAWVVWRLTPKRRARPGKLVYGVAIVLASLLFAAAHLPATRQIWPLGPVVIARALVLNGVAGLLCGVLYCPWGLEHAVAAHFMADLALHVVGGG